MDFGSFCTKQETCSCSFGENVFKGIIMFGFTGLFMFKCDAIACGANMVVHGERVSYLG